MSYWKPAASSDALKVRAIQKRFGILEDGILGSQTLDLIYRNEVGEGINTPYHERFYGVDVIFGKEVMVVDNDGSMLNAGQHPFSIAALFKHNMETISICVANGKPIDEQAKTSCHYFIGKPESVIYTVDGRNWEMKRCMTVNDLPANTRTAIGGVGLTNYSPVTEGFAKGSAIVNGKPFSYDYTDVLRKTVHAVFGVTEQNNLVGMMFYNHTAGEILTFLKSKFRLKHAVMLDGGHVPAINTPARKFNTALNQANLLVFK